jgi:uncharacterized membrane protein
MSVAAESQTCPACGGACSGDAVFCGCGKSLGEFDFIGEEFTLGRGWHESLADTVTGFVRRPQFIVAHVVWLGVWIALNTGLLAMVHRFDSYPFSLLGILLAIEAIFLSGFVLISQYRQNLYAEQSARLDYEVNVRTYREVRAARAAFEAALRRLEALETPNAGGASEGNNHD